MLPLNVLLVQTVALEAEHKEIQSSDYLKLMLSLDHDVVIDAIQYIVPFLTSDEKINFSTKLNTLLLLEDRAAPAWLAVFKV